MSRVVKKPDVRRDEIIKTAQTLFFTRGFHKTSIQDIVKTLKIAQGTFYYYFSSKMDVLDKMIETMLDTVINNLKQIVTGNMDPVKKINTLFASTASIKMSNKETLQLLLHVLYKEENVIIRYKMNEKTIRRAAPLYAEILQQGVDAHIFKIPNPDVTGTILMELIISTNEAISRILISPMEKQDKIDKITKRIASFSDVVEKVLGIAPGTIQVFNINLVHQLLSDDSQGS